MRKLIQFKKISWLIGFGFFFILMLQITSKYLPYNSHVAFLQIKQTEVTEVPFYLTFFYIHVYTAIFSLVAGFTQFNKNLLLNNPEIHRNLGKVYILTVLVFAAPSGLFIGFYANGGLWSKISFVTLAILWFCFTLKGYIYAKNRNILLHKSFMLRSFALAFSAITLRFWKVIIVYLFEPNPMDVYQIVAWLGWIPNLLIIEYYIFKNQKT